MGTGNNNTRTIMRQMSEPRIVIFIVFDQSAVRCGIWYSVRCRDASGYVGGLEQASCKSSVAGCSTQSRTMTTLAGGWAWGELRS